MIDELWASWFSGFFDGEGTMHIHLNEKGEAERGFNIGVGIAASIADKNLLRDIQAKLEIGNCLEYTRKARTKSGFAMCIEWRSSSRADLLRVVVPLFDRYPLRSKKQYEYVIWRKALMLMAAKVSPLARLTELDVLEVSSLRAELLATRKPSYISEPAAPTIHA